METPWSLKRYSSFQHIFLYRPKCCATLEIYRSERSLESCVFSGLNLMSMAAACSVCCSVAFLVSFVDRERSRIDLTFSVIN